MKELTIAGGVYHGNCIWPAWSQIYGSGGRAAATATTHVQAIKLISYAGSKTAAAFAAYADAYGFRFEAVGAEQPISFNYFHSLSVPFISPVPARIRQNAPIHVTGDVVLRFGMMEGSAVVTANRCVYDPQSAFNPERFEANGSRANHLAIVANRGEIAGLTGQENPSEAAQTLLEAGAAVVVVKSGVDGAFIHERSGVTHVPAYKTDRSWTIGSGDVFAAIFAAQWGVMELEAADAAVLASKAVAEYVESMALPSPPVQFLTEMDRPPAVRKHGRIYLAGPFFSLGQRWVVDEARRCLYELGMNVFSPVHDVGHGPAEQVAPSDLNALLRCDAVFAILDGNDPGTLFEVGYANAKGIPVYALAQTVSDEDLKMVTGSNCFVFDDFVTGLHHVVWRL